MKPIVFGVELVLWKLVFFVLILLLSGCIQPKQPSAGNGAVDANSGSNQTIVSSQPSLMPDVSGCGSIQGSKERDECYNSFAVSGCGSIQDSKMAADCYDFFAVSPQTQILSDANLEYRASACARITEPTSRDSCYNGLSSWRVDNEYVIKEESFCDKIQALGYKNYCYARLTSDDSFCEKAEPVITESGTIILKYSCYAELAELKKDPALCDKIDAASLIGASLRNGCYHDVALAEEDSSICEKISSDDLFWRDDCFFRIAGLKQDALVCGSIRDENVKRDCETNMP